GTGVSPRGCWPCNGAPRGWLALYVYEYLLHVGAQKSAQTFLSEIRWEKNITLGEPPGFLHSWWCVFWDLYCAAPDRRETCEHSSEAKAFHDYVSTVVLGGGLCAPAPPPPFTLPPPPQLARPPTLTHCPVCPPPPSQQPPVGVPGSQPLLPNAMDPAGIPAWGGPMQRMNPPRGMAGMAPQVRGIAYSSSSPGNYVVSIGVHLGGGGPCCRQTRCAPPLPPQLTSLLSPPQGPPGGGGPPGTPILPSPGDSTNSSENMYTMMNPIGPAGNRPNFPMGPGPEGPMGGMSAMEPHHMNGSLGGYPHPKTSPSNLGALSNPPGTPRDDAELSSNFLNPFQSDSYSPSMTMSV
uniref:Single stranded DNA binding protein 4 n=1 Tax=Aquila chrysaetos chrysaetos TaxID=223781 RepID=A0A663EC40_AQUCH